MLWLTEARVLADKFVSELKPYCRRIEIAGSIRRKCTTVKDMEIVLIPDPQYMQLLYHTILSHNRIKGAIGGRYIQIEYGDYFKADIFFATEKNWGLIFAIRTGSADFSKGLACAWVKLGYEGRDGTLYKTETDEPVDVPEEETLFRLLGTGEVPPPEARQGYYKTPTGYNVAPSNKI